MCVCVCSGLVCLNKAHFLPQIRVIAEVTLLCVCVCVCVCVRERERERSRIVSRWNVIAWSLIDGTHTHTHTHTVLLLPCHDGKADGLQCLSMCVVCVCVWQEKSA